jgi:hypothetical protein
MRIGVAIQAAFCLLTLMLLDAGREHQYFLAAMLARWVGILLIVLRRRGSPTRSDLLFISFALLPLMVIAHYIAPLVWRYIGASTRNGLERWLDIPDPSRRVTELEILLLLCWLLLDGASALSWKPGAGALSSFRLARPLSPGSVSGTDIKVLQTNVTDIRHRDDPAGEE